MGSRLGSLCRNQPKCLIDIEDNSLLEIQLNILHARGIEDITVVRGYRGEKIDIPGVKYYDNPDYENTGMLHSLFCAGKELTTDTIVLYSDIIYEEQVLRRLMESHHDIAVGVLINWQEAIKQRTEAALEKLEMVCFDSENRLQEIGKHLIHGKQLSQKENLDIQGQFTGMVKFTLRGVTILKKHYDRLKDVYKGNRLKKEDDFSNLWLTDIFREMTDLGAPLHCVVVERGWMEIDTPEDYERALTDTRFVRRLVRVKTDWNVRSQLYNQLDWVNRDELLKTMVEMAAVRENQKVLDVGTGTGKVLMALKEHCPEVEYYGTDISQSMLDKIPQANGLRLSLGQIENLEQFENDTFDLVTARMVFHHSLNLQKAVSEIYRVLKPGGKFILCEGNPPDRHSFSFYENMFRFKEERHTFMLDDLINLYVEQGFKDILSRTVIMENMSLNNWLDKSGLPFRNVDIIKKMHYECDALVQKAYKMEFLDDDILMQWKFSLVSGAKPV